MVSLVILALLVAGVTAWYVVLRTRERRVPRELHGDWWPEFERQFRAYASTTGALGRRRHRRTEESQ